MNPERQVEPDHEELDLMDLFRILMKSWKLITVLFLSTIIIAGSVTYFFIPKKYRSHTLFIIEAEGEFASTFGKVNMVKDVIQTNYFLGGILEKCGLDPTQATIEQLKKAVTITQTGAGNIRLILIWDNPQKAHELLTLIYNSYQEDVADRIRIYTTQKLEAAEEELNRSKEIVDQANAELVAFQKNNGVIFFPEQLVVTDRYYQDLKGWLTVSPGNFQEYENLVVHHAAVREFYMEAYKAFAETRRLVEKERKYEFVTIEPPVFPEQKYSPSTVMNTAVAGVLALFVGVMLAFLRDYVHNYKERERAANAGQGC